MNKSEWEAGEWVEVPCSLAGFHTCGSWAEPLSFPCSEPVPDTVKSEMYVSHVDYDKKEITLSTRWRE